MHKNIKLANPAYDIDKVELLVRHHHSPKSANIAEGNGRHKGKEYEHYLIIARGLSQRLRTGLSTVGIWDTAKTKAERRG